MALRVVFTSASVVCGARAGVAPVAARSLASIDARAASPPGGAAMSTTATAAPSVAAAAALARLPAVPAVEWAKPADVFARTFHGSAPAKQLASGPVGDGGAAGAGSGAGAGGGGAVADDEIIFEVDQSNFAETVMKSPVPCILDCYADWCGPCKQLTPILEDIVRAAGGTVRLAKLNTDNNPELSQGLGVRSLPTVLGIFQGRMIDNFIGLQPPERIEKFMKAVAAAGGETPAGASPGDEAQAALDEAVKYLAEGDSASAAMLYQRVLAVKDGDIDDAHRALQLKAKATAGIIECAMANDDTEAMTAYLELMKTTYARHAKDEGIANVIAAAELKLEMGDEASDMAALNQAVRANPDDLDARYKLAQGLFASGRHQDAVLSCLELIKADRHWNKDAARLLLLKIFEALGAAHPVTVEGRRKLASLILV